ncbi:MAG: FAD-dependent oxidoreductase [Chloroflexi bacterium]|jgi:ferredoxin--NADP+ reductase|nr:FAD-dependent oxidoreductase [Chloroflexota bacterium]
MTQKPDNDLQPIVAVIGAGPAGLYAARQLASEGVRVVLINRDIKPGGLAEYGIYHDKHKMKEGLRKQFRQILENPKIDYLGNLTVGLQSDLHLQDLLDMGFHAILVTVGAQGTKWLGLPGEDLKGVYHAKDLVYHYNRLPPYSTQEFLIGKRVALIGVGNVMLDIAHWTIRELKVDEVIAVARRGPAEVKFSKKEMEIVARNLDLKALDQEIARCAPIMRAVGQDPQAAKDYILSALPKALDPVSDTRFRLEFLASPTRILGDEDGRVCGLEVQDTTLVLENGRTRARKLDTTRVIPADTVVFCIGDRVDESFGLPVEWNEFVKNPQPDYPVDGLSYEAYDPQAGRPIEGVFVAGWSREASSGLVGVARKDGENGAKAVLQYLQAHPGSAAPEQVLDRLEARLQLISRPVIRKDDIKRLEAFECAEAERQGLEYYKCLTNEEMLAAIGLEEVSG